jgi:hypothetical protein
LSVFAQKGEDLAVIEEDGPVVRKLVPAGFG